MFYHPVTYEAIQKPYPVCSTYNFDRNDINKKNIILFDKCNVNDNSNNNDYINYNIFDDDLHIGNTTNDFLIKIYNINNIIELIDFINNNFNDLPIYTQQRLLNYFLDVYIIHDDFPIKLIAEKILEVFFKIYKINLNINRISYKIKSIKSKTKKINNNFIYNNNDFFNYLFNKYSK
jgi:hypothetical protein